MNMGFPDVCLTPAGPAVVPVPYPNIALNAQALGFSPVVKISGVNALNMGSQIPMTSGDEAGVAHPMIKGPSRYTMGNPIVNIDRLPAINLACPTTGNNMNNALGAVLVPSAVNVMFCQRGQCEGEALAEAAIEEARDLGAGVWYLRLRDIAPGVASEIHAALEKYAPRALVLDLRGNPGGPLDCAVDLAEYFLPEGAVIAHLEQAADRETLTARGSACSSVALCILIDELTASAAELFTAALQDNGRALVVGRRSYGKNIGYRWVSDGEREIRQAALRWERPSTSRKTRIRPDVPTNATGDALVHHAWGLALSLAG